jgi:hypothetical protein
LEDFQKEGGDGQRLQAVLTLVLRGVMRACATMQCPMQCLEARDGHDGC